MCEGTTSELLLVNFTRTKGVIFDMNPSLAFIHHKLEFETHESKTLYSENMHYKAIFKVSMFLEWKSLVSNT